MSFLDLFKKKSTPSKDETRVKSVTIYWNTAFAMRMGGSVISNSGILLDLNTIEKDSPSLAQKMRSYMAQYNFVIKKLENLPSCKSFEELKQFVAKNLKSSTIKEFALVGNSQFWFLYLLEYGEPDLSLKLRPLESKEMKIIMFAQNALDPKYEKYAQEIVDIFIQQDIHSESLDIFDSKLTIVGKKISDFERMTLIAYRAEALAREQNTKGFTIRYLVEYSWKGVEGWDKYRYNNLYYI